MVPDSNQWFGPLLEHGHELLRRVGQLPTGKSFDCSTDCLKQAICLSFDSPDRNSKIKFTLRDANTSPGLPMDTDSKSIGSHLSPKNLELIDSRSVVSRYPVLSTPPLRRRLGASSIQSWDLCTRPLLAKNIWRVLSYSSPTAVSVNRRSLNWRTFRISSKKGLASLWGPFLATWRREVFSTASLSRSSIVPSTFVTVPIHSTAPSQIFATISSAMFPCLPTRTLPHSPTRSAWPRSEPRTRTSISLSMWVSRLVASHQLFKTSTLFKFHFSATFSQWSSAFAKKMASWRSSALDCSRQLLSSRYLKQSQYSLLLNLNLTCSISWNSIACIVR